MIVQCKCGIRERGELRGTLEGHLSLVNSLAFCPVGQLVVSTSSDGTVLLWDTITAELRGTLEGHSAWVGSVVLSPNKHLVASGSEDKTVRLWDVRNVELWDILEGSFRSSQSLRASYILASLYLRRKYASIFKSAQSLQLRTARNLVKDLTRSINATLKFN